MKKNEQKSEKKSKKVKKQDSLKLIQLCPYVLLLIASALMLTVIQAPIDLSFLAWISFVPFIIAAYYTKEIRSRKMYFVVYIVSVFYWLGNLYWIFPITIAGWLVLCLYTALLWPLLFFCLRYCMKKKVPLFLASAILIAGIERMQGIFLGGFFWRFLAHSQYKNITIIQIADIFGACGVSCLIAMVNGLFADLITASREKKLFTAAQYVKTGIVASILIVCVIYGRWRLGQEAEFVEEGPLAASLQSNVPQSVKNTFESSEDIFDGLMKDSNEVSAHKPELIVWPETMVQATLNPGILSIMEDDHIWNVLDQRLKEHAENNAFLLIGAYGGTPAMTEDQKYVILDERFNSAFLYNNKGQKTTEVYDKIHLVPFGEVLPLRNSMAWFYEMLMKVKFIPYDFDYSLDYGSNYTIFKMTGSEGQKYKFSVIICYEDTVPVLPRRFALDKNGEKQIDWLVNISNDGWFVRWGNEKIMPSTELPQHAAVCTFRAVENRLAVLRSVNTGISCLIDSSGRIKNGYINGTLPENAMARTGISGWFIDKIPIDKRTAFFSKYGEWLDFLCEFCVFFVIIASLSGRFVRFKKG
ncbi:MAG: apolipoprotein N-acyltransferase [Sedimentisphaerales bacterium]|nr:apolipoprotein N-acyltransferase [Sedimentisphaerales bacterium]